MLLKRLSLIQYRLCLSGLIGYDPGSQGTTRADTESNNKSETHMPTRVRIPRLLIIPVNGEIETYHFDHSELKYGCPTFADIRKLLGFPDRQTLEIVHAKYEGGEAHFFVDEDGRIEGRPLNLTATRMVSYCLGRPLTESLVGPVAVWTGTVE